MPGVHTPRARADARALGCVHLHRSLPVSQYPSQVCRAPGRSPCAAHALVVVVALAVPVLGAGGQQSGEDARRNAFRSIEWVDGPVQGSLGAVAEVRVPAGCRFTEAAGAKAFMIATENPPSGREEGVLVCRAEGAGADSADSGTWFVVFSYDPSGYVKDDEKEKLDADAILATLREGTEAGNDERRSRGWETLTLEGWVRPPYYDSATHNLTWSTRARAASGVSVNHSVRLLGRGGVLHADLVLDPELLASALGRFDAVIAGTEFRSGNTYAEWRSGDKVAEYGLTALIAGGAGAAAMKLGLFGKLWKLVLAFALAAKKLIILLVAGVGSWLRSLFRKKGANPGTAGEGSAG